MSVDSSATDLRKLASALRAYKEDVKNAGRTIERQLGSVHFDAKKRQQFEARFRDHKRQVDRFMDGDVNGMVKSLEDLARRLDEISRMKM
jgi:DNA repair ATPase RecN